MTFKILSTKCLKKGKLCYNIYRTEVCNMKIEMWFDFACPFCYLGKISLTLALEQFPYSQRVFIDYKSYELHNFAQSSYDTMLAREHGLTTEQMRNILKDVKKQAKNMGVGCHFEKIKPINTLDAHRLVKYAIKVGKGDDMITRLFQAFFKENKDLSDHSTLYNLSQDVGLNQADVESLLVTNQYKRAVHVDEEEAKELGVKNVPFFIFNDIYALSGTYSPKAFLQALEDIWEKTKRKNRPKNTETLFCIGDDCEQSN